MWKIIGHIFNAEHLATEQMQKIAAEINFAESTFVTALDKRQRQRSRILSDKEKKCSLWTSHNWDYREPARIKNFR
jgi:hypothetical protein